MKKLLIALCAALLLCAACAGCGDGADPSAPVVTAVVSAEPTAEPTAEAPNATESPATPAPTLPPDQDDRTTVPGDVGVYSYATAEGSWTLDLRENGTYTLTETQGLGDAAKNIPHTGESWVVNEDGSVTCSPTDIWQISFSFSDGCSTWLIYSDGTCSPVLVGG